MDWLDAKLHTEDDLGPADEEPLPDLASWWYRAGWRDQLYGETTVNVSPETERWYVMGRRDCESHYGRHQSN